MDFSIDSLDIPLKKPVFESTVLADEATNPKTATALTQQDSLQHSRDLHLLGTIGDYKDEKTTAPVPETLSKPEPLLDLQAEEEDKLLSEYLPLSEIAGDYEDDETILPVPMFPQTLSAFNHKESMFHLQDSNVLSKYLHSGENYDSLTPRLTYHRTLSALDHKDSFLQLKEDIKSISRGLKGINEIMGKTSVNSSGEKEFQTRRICEQCQDSLTESKLETKVCLNTVTCGLEKDVLSCVSLPKKEHSILQHNFPKFNSPVTKSHMNYSVTSSSNVHVPTISNPPTCSLNSDMHNRLFSPVVRTKIDPCTQNFEEKRPVVTPDHIKNTSIHIEDTPTTSLDHKHSVGTFYLSPWEKWMVKKAKEEREKRETLRLEKLARESKKAESMEIERKRREKAEQIHKKWVQQKKIDDKAKREAEQREFEAQKETAEQAKANASYQEWYNKMKRERAKLNQKMKELEKQKALKEKEAKLQSDHAYRTWLQTVGCKRIDRELCLGRNNSLVIRNHKDKLLWHI